MSYDDPIRLAKTPPPAGMHPEAVRVWRRVAPLVDRAGVVVLRKHAPFAFRALCESVAINKHCGAALKDEAGWLRAFGLTPQAVEQVL